VTVGEYLKRWLEAYAGVGLDGSLLHGEKRAVSPRVAERYAGIVRIHLIPHIGQHLLNKLQPLHIQECYAKILEAGRAPRTVLQVHRVLHRALECAVKWQILGRNVADAVEPPRPDRFEARVLDERETGRLLDALRDTRLFVPTLLAITTGLRRGELLALRWQDVDLGAGMLSVRKTLEQTRSGVRFKEPKSAKSRRSVVLPPIAVEALRRHRVEQAKEKLLFGPDYQDYDLVFPMPGGTPWEPDKFSDLFRRTVQAKGFRIRFHDLRHTHATQLLRQGIHPKVVSERLGHSTIATTMDIYSHVLPGIQEEAARKLDSVLRASMEAKNPPVDR
jgi:integrase